MMSCPVTYLILIAIVGTQNDCGPELILALDCQVTVFDFLFIN
jgi:hypothetical protein